MEGLLYIVVFTVTISGNVQQQETWSFLAIVCHLNYLLVFIQVRWWRKGIIIRQSQHASHDHHRHSPTLRLNRPIYGPGTFRVRGKLFFRNLTQKSNYCHKCTCQKCTMFSLTLNASIATKVVCFSRLLKCFRSLYGKQCGPRSDCSYRSSLFWVHAVCFYTWFVSNDRQLFTADDFSRRHFQMHFFPWCFKG